VAHPPPPLYLQPKDGFDAFETKVLTTNQISGVLEKVENVTDVSGRFRALEKGASGTATLGPKCVPRVVQPAEVLERLLAALRSILRPNGETGEEGRGSCGEGR
jgi:hypothetical protein